MNKNNFLTLGIGFIAGMGLTCGYFILASNDLEPDKLQQSNTLVQKTHAPEPKNNEVTVNNTVPAVTEQAVSLEQSETTTSTAFEPQEIDELPLEEQVVQLKLQLAKQKTLMESVEKKPPAPNDVEAALQAQFDEQQRNEEWAYQTETALQDFLLTADLASMPDIVSAECKSSVCKFKLAAPTGNDTFDHTHWRELNDKLMKQEFWLQFKRTTSTSSDSELTLLMTTEL